MAVPRPYRNWFLAEGATHNGFEEFILLGNTNDSDVVANLQFLLDGGGAVQHQVLVPANSRQSVNVESVPGMQDVQHATRITADLPLIVERAMYLTSNDGVRRGAAHDTVGSPVSDDEWFLAEGRTGGVFQFEEFILMANTNPVPVSVDLTYLLGNGTAVPQQVVIEPNARLTVKVNDVPGLANVSHSTKLKSNRPIFVERAMYWSYGGFRRIGAHDSFGVPELVSPELSAD
jgi:hypothetical protein